MASRPASLPGRILPPPPAHLRVYAV